MSAGGESADGEAGYTHGVHGRRSEADVSVVKLDVSSGSAARRIDRGGHRHRGAVGCRRGRSQSDGRARPVTCKSDCGTARQERGVTAELNLDDVACQFQKGAW